MRFKICLIFLFVLAVIYSCGIKKEIIPKYHFEIGKELIYDLKGQADVFVDMGLFTYNSKANIGAKLIFTPIETNEYGYKVRLDVKDPAVEGLTNQFQAAYFIGLNSIRKLLSEFYIDEYGKTKVFFNEKQIDYLSYALNIFFGELSPLGASFSTNIPGWVMKIPVMSKYSEERYVKQNKGKVLIIFQSANLISYEKEEFEKSVEPKPLGNASYEADSSLDLLRGEITYKDIKFNVKYNIPVKQGFITTYIRIECKGNIKLMNSGLEI
ncbi:MAG: hypothetical protein ACP5QT_00185 [Brevinematia bacterium]